MSFGVTWDVEKYREEHECEERWLLRKAFMERWKDNYPEERLICLAHVFANIEFMGCRYPADTMTEIATLSREVAENYRSQKRNKLQRTFVSASQAAQDRAKGHRRERGNIVEAPQKKSNSICFVKPELHNTEPEKIIMPVKDIAEPKELISPMQDTQLNYSTQKDKISQSVYMDSNEYLNDLYKLECVDTKNFHDSMFDTPYGRLVLLLRPWTSRISNIQVSVQACKLLLQCKYIGEQYSISINGKLVAEGHGKTRLLARQPAEAKAWEVLKTQVISVLIKEQVIAHNDAPIKMSDVSVKKQEHEFGTPVESSVASKMMKMMGWAGGGLGADAQGIEEPIKPHFQMVNRGGLGNQLVSLKELRRAAEELIRRYLASSSLDVDLVFSAEFSKEERAALHRCAQRAGLVSRSYGVGADRFLVVKKKLDPFSIVRGVIQEGGNTAKYQVFIPRPPNNDKINNEGII